VSRSNKEKERKREEEEKGLFSFFPSFFFVLLLEMRHSHIYNT
jgi:hypothetical protein